MPSITFSNAVSHGSSEGDWKHHAAIRAGAGEFLARENDARRR